MSQKIYKARFLALLISFFSLTGCVYLIIGGLGAVGGYVVSPDTVEGITGHDTISVFDEAVDLLSIMGTISERNESAGMVIAKVNHVKVTISISAINDSTTRLTVKARRAFIPKISVAQEIFVKLITQLNE